MRKSLRYALIGIAVAATASAVGITASLGAIQQDNVVNAVPSTATPNISDGITQAITRVGDDIVVGGTFTQVENRGSTTEISRPYILSFDSTTGTVETAFAPKLDGMVNTLQPGPTANTVYVGGAFNNVNGAKHPHLVLLNTLTGALVTTFKAPSTNGVVNSLAVTADELYVGGTFTTVGAVSHDGLASVSPTTGALDSYMGVQLTGHHNYNGTSGSKAAVGASVVKVSPNGAQMIVIGNFKTANGLDRDQAVMITLGTTATIANWETDALKSPCTTTSFDSWVRDVDFSPGGSYFVIDGTGGPHTGQNCDSVMRFESAATGSAIAPTWIDFTGGDTFLSVAITGASVYVGGHFRWLNNPGGHDSSAAGAIGRAGLAALDPATGLPQSWNPGRNPRGYGAPALFVDSDGLYVGSDTDYIGDTKYLRGKIAFFPLAGGDTPPAGKDAALPGHIFVEGSQVDLPTTLYRVNAGGPTVAATDGGIPWSADNSTGAQYSSGGAAVTFGKDVAKTDASVPAGTPAALFDSERDYTSSATAFTFPVPTGTDVSVKVFFAQRGWDSTTSAPTPRVETVSINGVASPALDLNAAFGYNTTGMESYSATSAGSIKISVAPSAGTASAEIDAIEIDRTGGTSTALGFGSRAFDGNVPTAATGAVTVDGTPWNTIKGAFLVDNELFYGLSDGNLYKRSFDGTNFGAPSLVAPYSDPAWDAVKTGSGTTVYAGVKPNFYGTELQSVTSMFFTNGKLYYTRAGQTGLFWRWFTPDSGVVGATEFTVSGATGFSTVSGVFFTNASGTSLYFSKTDGSLYRMSWNSGSPSGTATQVSGPGIDSFTWSTPGAFFGN